MSHLAICIAIVLPMCLTACIPTVPIPTLEYRLAQEVQQANLLILLRGRGGSHRDFEKYGIIDEIRKRDLPFDIVVPDAHFGYYMSESLHERLEEDILIPARAAGYHNIWIAGFSMGGLGGLFYLVNYPESNIDGLILCSPFLGDDIITEINAHGGLKNWAPPSPPNDKWPYRLWSWIKQYQQHPETYPPILLGYAQEDRITANGPALLETVLPADRTFSLPGGHDYPTFQAIWREYVNRQEPNWKKLSSSIAGPVE